MDVQWPFTSTLQRSCCLFLSIVFATDKLTWKLGKQGRSRKALWHTECLIVCACKQIANDRLPDEWDGRQWERVGCCDWEAGRTQAMHMLQPYGQSNGVKQRLN